MFSSYGENTPRDLGIDFVTTFDWEPPALVPPQSLTAILPILSVSLHKTQDLLEPFLHPLEHIREVVIVCPDAIASDVRRMLQKTFASLGSADHPDVSLRPWQGHLNTSAATLRAAIDQTTEWALIMDDTGLTDVLQSSRAALLHPPVATLPFGPNGVFLSNDSDSSEASFLWDRAQPAQYLFPPFVIPSYLVSSVRGERIDDNPWINLGRQIAKNRPDAVGGVIVLPDSNIVPLPSSNPKDRAESSPNLQDALPDWETNSRTKGHGNDSFTGSSSVCVSARFIFLLPTREDLRHLMPLICGMKSRDNHTHIRTLVYDEGYDKPGQLDWETEFLESYHCDVKYEVLTGRTPLAFARNGSTVLSQWLDESSGLVDVVFTLHELDHLVSFLVSEQKDKLFHGATVIRIPRLDLENTEWMASLKLEEWKNWHRPRIDISIITNDRPQSLTRLMNSLASARYFGDQPTLRVNVEQDCDADTLRIAENIAWPLGRLFIHHRVVHGGLLAAVVESWYPQDNDSYGLLLEDDVELSPLYYAWIKMTLLRYRYGVASDRTPNLFGISLYQQKHLELPMEGRQPFNPRSMFAEAGLSHPITPYLSPVPCSWGAIYFPEHWREFHDYLAVRLAETTLTIENEVVPDVRSNHWSKSWKKFFIELVYLRGYVMLYPNYEDFVSLSTNHLEVGSHVKLRSPEKQDLFLLPLMQLHRPEENSKLLDLPNHTLPPLDALPVLNLTGYITSLEALVEQGTSRRSNLIGCDSPTELYNIRSLMCISVTVAPGLFR
ncbi:hypothetical protein BDZ97DRAFT_1906800 [Flammula alnicola]|nr:hypothetical protein BDZ97DRAFT_1906800 [Flammula alnicola]